MPTESHPSFLPSISVTAGFLGDTEWMSAILVTLLLVLTSLSWLGFQMSARWKRLGNVTRCYSLNRNFFSTLPVASHVPNMSITTANCTGA